MNAVTLKTLQVIPHEEDRIYMLLYCFELIIALTFTIVTLLVDFISRK